MSRTSLLGLRRRQNGVSVFQIISDQLPALIIGIFGIGERVIVGLFHVRFYHERDVLIEAFEQEMAIRTQEFHLTQTLRLQLIRIRHGVKRVYSRIDTAQTIVETYPHVVDIPIGSHNTLADLQLVEYITIVLADTTLIGVIGTHIKVPHREGGVNILGGDEYRIRGDNYVVNIPRVVHLILTKDSLRHILIEEIIARCTKE